VHQPAARKAPAVNPSAAQEAPTVNLPATWVAAAAVWQQVGGRLVELEEDKVFAQIDGGGVVDGELWHLDTCVTNHMSRSRDVFSELDHGVVGTVRFGDGSVVKIEGRGVVLFSSMGSTAASTLSTTSRASTPTSSASVNWMKRATTSMSSMG
jgi:hypothetical protein